MPVTIDAILERGRRTGASDLHLAPGSPPMVRILGRLRRASDAELDEAMLEGLLQGMLSEEQARELAEKQSVDFAYQSEAAGRCRANVYRQRKGLSAVFRYVPLEIPSIESLGLPDKVREFAGYPHGLVLITGPAGQGKTSSLAALVRLINESRAEHVITIEEPIEYVHPRRRAVVNQREVGRHTAGFGLALRAALREDPDIIVIGELRDTETISNAIRAAETGHLVFGTLMTVSAHKTIDRILDSYPVAQQGQVRVMLSESLRAIVAQKLVGRADGKGFALATEILIGTTPVANLIREAKTYQLPSILQTGRAAGMHRLEDSLRELVLQNVITREAALQRANDHRILEELLQHSAAGPAAARAR